jgi:hypothetical protein
MQIVGTTIQNILLLSMLPSINETAWQVLPVAFWPNSYKFTFSLYYYPFHLCAEMCSVS